MCHESQQDFVPVLFHFQFCISFSINAVFGSEGGIAGIFHSSIYMVTSSTSIWISPRKLGVETSLMRGFVAPLSRFLSSIFYIWISHTSLASVKNSWTETAWGTVQGKDWIAFQVRNINVVLQNCFHLNL